MRILDLANCWIAGDDDLVKAVRLEILTAYVLREIELNAP